MKVKTDHPPEPTTYERPPYPRKALQKGIEGVLEAEMIVDTRGRVETVNLIQIPSKHFHGPALKTFRKWKFKPATVQGVPVRVRVKQVINYRLRK